MIRFAYNLLLLLAVPPAVLHLVIRGLVKDRGYWGHFAERFGFGPRAPRPTLWVHAVSFGEMQAAAPLVGALRQRYPQFEVLVTTFTPTGRSRARSLLGDSIDVRYVPFDLPGAVARFMARAQPRLVVIMETELWPNLFAACGRRGIPVLLASARLSPRSMGRYRRLVPLFREALSCGIVVGAQSDADARRFVAIGTPPERIHVTGNAKFDFEPEPATSARARRFREQYAPDRPLWIAGSTHEGEEEIVLDAHARLRERVPAALLVLVPRHPPRFAAVGALLSRRGWAFVARSSGRLPACDCPVVLGDTLGELTMLYGGADVAFVGGSLVPVGGHNLLEPASMGVPVLTGPHNFHGEEILRLFVAAGAACVVTDAMSLAATVERLLTDDTRRRRAGEAGLQVIEANRGSVRALLALVESLLGETRER